MTRTRQVTGKEEMKFTVVETSLGGDRWRTDSIEGTIRVVQGREPHGGAERSAFDHHGHLIADVFGGPGGADSGNIVAMHGHQNFTGEYREMERRVREMLGDGTGHMRVDVGYANPADSRPHVFRIRVTYGNGMHSQWRIFNYASYLPNPNR